MGKNQIGIVGLAAMGSNLAMNFADHGFRVAVFNRSSERTEALLSEYGEGRGLVPMGTLDELALSLEVPRKIILMVKAGSATDAVIAQLALSLEEGDIIIDGGNSFFRDTERRAAGLRDRGIRFVGMGISGGEEGARRGPSMMPGVIGGEWLALQPLVEAIAAKDFDGNPCVAPIGPGGAGHFVKMVHNGIEYADMEFIAEAYWLMRRGLGLGSDEIADVFERWNGGRLQSYLIEITASVLRTKEADGGHLIDRILDSAGSKGTGKWTTDQALELGSPSFSIAASVFARYASAHKETRLDLAKLYSKGDNRVIDGCTVDDIESALYVAKLIAYAQGYELMSLAATEYEWTLDFKEISRIWQGGCIIRARFLSDLASVYAKNPGLGHLLLAPFAEEVVVANIAALRKVSSASVSVGIPLPGFLSSVSYFDTMRSAVLPASLIQAQRDFFGAHTFQREIGGASEHFDWAVADMK